MTEQEENQKLVGAYTGCLYGFFPLLLSLWSAIFGFGMADWLYKYLLPPGMWLAVAMIVLLPLCCFKALRGRMGAFLLIASFLIGAVVIVVSVCAIGAHWGRTGVIVSCFVGPGVAPMALVASFLNQDWWGVSVVGAGSAVTVFSRIFGLSLFFTSLPSAEDQSSLKP